MDSAKDVDDVVVMDLEGTDSSERGEDRGTFERQSVLFVLAIAEVLIINMDVKDVGRYTGSNFGILKTVFEVNLQLFKNKSKTILMFVIRDHDEEQGTPLAALRDRLLNEMRDLWKDVRKPAEFEESDISEFFEIEFVGLADFRYRKEQFHEQVGVLRSRFSEASRDDYVFKYPFHFDKTVPADGFAHFASNVWRTIVESKELDLPSQKEMLATYRCDEIAQSAFNKLSTELQPLRDAGRKALVDNLGTQTTNLINAALSEFNDVASRYTPTVVSVKRQELTRKIADELKEVFMTQMEHARRQTTGDFADALKKRVPDDNTPAPHFFDLVDELVDLAVQSLREHFDSARLRRVHLDAKSDDDSKQEGEGEAGEAASPEAATLAELHLDWSFDVHEAQMRSEIEKIVEQQRLLQVDRVVHVLCEEVKKKSGPRANTVFGAASPNMWDRLSVLHAKRMIKSSCSLVEALVQLRCTDEEMNKATESIRQASIDVIREQADRHLELINLKMRKRFDETFRKDENGLPRRWNTNIGIRDLFSRAREDGLQVLELFSRFQLRSVSGLKKIETVSSLSLPELAEDNVVDNSTDDDGSGDDAEEEEEEENVGGNADETVGDEFKHDESKTKDKNKQKNKNKNKHHVGERRMLVDEELLDKARQGTISSQYEMEIEGALLDAEQAQERYNANTKLPPWALVMLAVLGFDEFMAVLRNPLLLLLLILVGAGLWFLHRTGTLSPALAVGKSMLQQFMQQASASIQPPPQQQQQHGQTLHREPAQSSAHGSASSPSRNGGLRKRRSRGDN
eukprot:TRINITY_DN66931_c7_g13_i2.p1 TRINITY_DN66931_c7_g13~~TRINITY_DN66931_c7_g13_i2.p1  ORF type:complete len:798 (-),score=459.54 TRINITY_DN66931_c7_g13_i2:154-2547(-)